MNMNRKLLFFDIDGTLLPTVDGPVPESAKEGIRRARERGHYVFVNTGRTKCVIPRELMEMELDGYLCGCGTRIELKGQILVHEEFDGERGMELIRHARREKIPVVLEGSEYCYIDSQGAGYERMDVDNNPLMAQFPGRLLDVAKCSQVHFSKFCAIVDSRERLDQFLVPFSGCFEVIDQGNHFYEIVPSGFSKATAIDKVVEFLGQTLGDCYVFGDSANDLSMLDHVPHSIAMGNSDEAALRAASYVTTPAWRDGVCMALKHFGLIPVY